MRKFSRYSIPVVILAMAALCFSGTWAPTTATAAERPLPIVFVHGFNGSAAQYETQALRWASNNYPKPVIGVDRTTSVSADLNPMLDAFFDAVMAETGDSQIYVVAHSLGTFLMPNYLTSSPARAARVAKYIGIDGLSLPACPAGVPCMGIWARGAATRALGANNIQFADQGHTQSVGSAESFVAQYQFLTGTTPATTLVLPEPPGQVEIAGRALNYPDNTGIIGATLELWEVDRDTGARKHWRPEEHMILDATGNFGPWKVNGEKRYELAVIRQADPLPSQSHFYYEPFIRSNYLLRLNIALLDSALSQTIRGYTGPHVGVSVVRSKEWWGNNTLDPTNVDVLNILTRIHHDVTNAGNVVTAGTAPYAASTISMIMFDVANDGVTHTDALVNLGPFLAGLDVYMPAPDTQPRGKVAFAAQQRQTNHPQTIYSPNWSMDPNHFVNIMFRDWVQDIDSWDDCRRAHPSPCKSEFHCPWQWGRHNPWR